MSSGVSLRIDPRQALPSELRRIALELAGDALARLDAKPAAPDAVHEVRKRLKELRALLRLAEEGHGLPILRNARHLAREAGRSLSAAREIEALTETFTKLHKRFGDEVTAPSMVELRDALVPASGAEAGFGAPRRMVNAARAELMRCPFAATPDCAATAMRRNYAAARRAMGRAYETRATTDFHEWRKREKELWYHARMLAAHIPSLDRLEPALHRLSRLLGDHHDLAVMRDLCAAHASAARAGDVIRLLALLRLRMREVEDEAEMAGGELFAVSGRAWIARLMSSYDGSRRTLPG